MISVRGMAKFIALHLTSGKFDTQDLYARLADNPRQLRNLKLRAQKEDLTGTERKICEAFIKNWANVRPKQENKVNQLYFVDTICSFWQLLFGVLLIRSVHFGDYLVLFGIEG